MTATALPEHDVVEVGPIRLDRDSMVATVNGTALYLSRKEYQLLDFMLSDPGKVFRKQDLLRGVWPEYRNVPEHVSTLSSHISRVRVKLRQAGAEGYCRNVWGTGYALLPATA